MVLATWWRSDPAPILSPVENMIVRTTANVPLIAAATGNTAEEVSRRLDSGHRAYLALVDGQPASYGWVATRSADIGEISVAFELATDERYLWDFKTRPEFRGRGIYPRLLGHIIEQESRSAERLWILAAPENSASNTGIGRANFQTVGTIGFRSGGQPVLVPEADLARAEAGGRLLGLPVTFDATRPCWACELTPACGCSAGGGGTCVCHHAATPAREPELARG